MPIHFAYTREITAHNGSRDGDHNDESRTEDHVLFVSDGFLRIRSGYKEPTKHSELSVPLELLHDLLGLESVAK